jgi:hypothetical protein
MSRESLEADEFIGTVKLKSEWKFFVGSLGEWTLDYDAFDPSFHLSSEKNLFRGGLTKIDETNAEKYMEAMQNYELSTNEIQQLIATQGIDEVPLMFVVDFDNRTFVNGYYDYPLEKYVPEGWKSYLGNTYEYVPENVRALWEY